MEQAERRERVERLLDHYEFPRHEGRLEEPDVEMPGGNSECGDVVRIYLKGAGDRIEALTFEGEGCTISVSAASMLLQVVHQEGLTMDEVLQMGYSRIVEEIGPQIAASRPRCATLALGTLKAAVKEYHRRRRLQANTTDTVETRQDLG